MSKETFCYEKREIIRALLVVHVRVHMYGDVGVTQGQESSNAKALEQSNYR
jgi:hypothetical protein